MISLLATVLVLQAVSQAPSVVVATEAAANVSADTAADGRVVVILASGRRVSGQIDPKTDADRLWLRSSRPGITLLRPIAWDRVLRVDLPETRVAGVELLSAVKLLVADQVDATASGGP